MRNRLLGGGGVLDAGVLAERLALDPVGVEQPLALLGQPHVEGEQLAVGLGVGDACVSDAEALRREGRRES